MCGVRRAVPSISGMLTVGALIARARACVNRFRAVWGRKYMDTVVWDLNVDAANSSTLPSTTVVKRVIVDAYVAASKSMASRERRRNRPRAPQAQSQERGGSRNVTNTTSEDDGGASSYETEQETSSVGSMDTSGYFDDDAPPPEQRLTWLNRLSSTPQAIRRALGSESV